MEIEISVAQQADASEIRALQQRAFLSEAKRYNNLEIEPLRQTLEEIMKDFNTHTFLKAIHEDRIVGSVKLRTIGSKCWIGRLIVDPLVQRTGIGTKLLKKLEEITPDVIEYFLYTGSESDGNIIFYKKLGYLLDGNSMDDNGIKLVGLSKNRA